MLGRTDRRLRMVALLVVFALFGSATMLRLGYWQVVAAPDLVARAIDTMAPPDRRSRRPVPTSSIATG